MEVQKANKEASYGPSLACPAVPGHPLLSPSDHQFIPKWHHPTPSCFPSRLCLSSPSSFLGRNSLWASSVGSWAPSPHQVCPAPALSVLAPFLPLSSLPGLEPRTFHICWASHLPLNCTLNLSSFLSCLFPFLSSGALHYSRDFRGSICSPLKSCTLGS